MNGYYGKTGYVSVWIGDCVDEASFVEAIRFRETTDESMSRFLLGESFGIKYYDDSCSLVNYLPEKTANLDAILDTGAPDYVVDAIKTLIGDKITGEYNCCVMFFEMMYTGPLLETKQRTEGAFIFVGSVEADVMDI